MAANFIFLTKPIPKVPTHIEHSFPILVFDTTIVGYRQAVQWLRKHPECKEVYRIVIPYDGYDRPDVGDYIKNTLPTSLYAKQVSTVNVDVKSRTQRGMITNMPADHIFTTLVPLHPFATEPDPGEVWPFVSKNRMVDLTYAIMQMEDDILLRDGMSGLSVLQQYLLSHKDLFDTEEELIAGAMGRFKLVQGIIKKQHWQLKTLIRHVGPGFDILPTAILNGSFPLDASALALAVKSRINTNHEVKWDKITLRKNTFDPVQLISHAQLSPCGMYVIGLPWGVSPDEFAALHPGSDQRNGYNEVSFYVSYLNPSMVSMSTVATWNGKFAGGLVFDRMGEYMEWWIVQNKAVVSNARCMLEKLNDVTLLKKAFLRSLYVSDEDTADSEIFGSKRIRVFADESPQEKVARIESKYEGHLEFLNLPVSLIDSDYIFLEKLPVVPKYTLDLWNDYLNLIS